MSAPGALRGQTVDRWAPPDLDLVAVLEKLRQWQPFDGDAFLDDVGTVLEFSPAEEQVEDLAGRLRGYSMRLVNIAIAHAPQDATTARLVDRACTLRSEEVPGGFWQAVGHLRRTAWTLADLYDHLIAAQCVKEPA
ncbi:DUF6415 family natural product biosynthesis protein [Streptomyces sp. NPDC014846]|uniref:DUF6415 family natural product biosynthesis protein n=1 Tax=Streptomyces sp. NPDC014846 TaxID=3364922 RepID=UPI0036F548EC